MNDNNFYKITDRLNDVSRGLVLINNREDFKSFIDYLDRLGILELFNIDVKSMRLSTMSGKCALMFHVVTDDSWNRLAGIRVNCIFSDGFFDQRFISLLRSPEIEKRFIEFI